MVNVLVLRGPEGTRQAFAANRKARAEAGLAPSTTERFGYAAMVAVGQTHDEGMRIGEKLLWFLNTSIKSAPQYSKFLAGAAPAEAAPMIYRSRPRTAAGQSGTAVSANANAQTLMGITPEQAMARGILFAGDPDEVYRQIMDFSNTVGGFGHLVMIGRSGFMTHAETEASIKLFAREILPRLKEVQPVPAGFDAP